MSSLTTLFILFCLHAMMQSSMSSNNSNSKNSRNGGSNGFLQSEPTWESKTKGYDAEFFYWGKGMDRKYLSVATNLESYVGEKYGTSALTFMTSNKKKVQGKQQPLTDIEIGKQSSDDNEIRSMMMKEYAKKLLILEKTTGRVYHFLNAALSSYATNKNETGTVFYPT